MGKQTIYIKNMVCNRCIMVVEEILGRLGLEPLAVKLGEVQLAAELTPEQQQSLREELQRVGFELIDSKQSRLIAQIKTRLIELVRDGGRGLRMNLSDWLEEEMHYDYTYLSNLFSEVENTTIEQYFIALKIEQVKELLVYDELNLNEIADLLNYSSAAYLSAQFKKVTGLTPTHFRQVGARKRNPLDRL